MTHCLFCKISEGLIPAEIVYEDEYCLAFKDIHPQAKTHWLVIPRQHIDNVFALQSTDQAVIGHLLCQIPQIAKQAHLDAGFKLITNSGKAGGQEIYHLHFHLVSGDFKLL